MRIKSEALVGSGGGGGRGGITPKTYEHDPLGIGNLRFFFLNLAHLNTKISLHLKLKDFV